eukprot:Pgem_evm1s3745
MFNNLIIFLLTNGIFQYTLVEATRCLDYDDTIYLHTIHQCNPHLIVQPNDAVITARCPNQKIRHYCGALKEVEKRGNLIYNCGKDKREAVRKKKCTSFYDDNPIYRNFFKNDARFCDDHLTLFAVHAHHGGKFSKDSLMCFKKNKIDKPNPSFQPVFKFRTSNTGKQDCAPTGGDAFWPASRQGRCCDGSKPVNENGPMICKGGSIGREGSGRDS